MLWMSSWVHPYSVMPAVTMNLDVLKKIRMWGWAHWLSCHAVMMSWLRLPTTPDCIWLSYHIHWKCLSTLSLRCCGWDHGCILTMMSLLRMQWSYELYFHRTQDVSVSGNDVMMSRLRCPTLMSASHFHIIYIESVWARWDAVGELMGASLQCYACSGQEPRFS